MSGALDEPGARRLFDYTSWANRRILGCAAELAPDDFTRDLGASHGGVRGTLTHMLSAEWIWLERFRGGGPERHLEPSAFAAVTALAERWAGVDRERDAWLAGLAPGGLGALCRYRNFSGQPFEAPLWQLVQHVANHSSFHRGQVVLLLRQLGRPLPATDLVAWDRGP